MPSAGFDVSNRKARARRPIQRSGEEWPLWLARREMLDRLGSLIVPNSGTRVRAARLRHGPLSPRSKRRYTVIGAICCQRRAAKLERTLQEGGSGDDGRISTALLTHVGAGFLGAGDQDLPEATEDAKAIIEAAEDLAVCSHEPRGRSRARRGARRLNDEGLRSVLSVLPIRNGSAAWRLPCRSPAAAGP